MEGRGRQSLPPLPTDEECLVYRLVYASPPVHSPREAKAPLAVSTGAAGEGLAGRAAVEAGERADGTTPEIGTAGAGQCNNMRKHDYPSSPSRLSSGQAAAKDDSERREDLLYRCYYPSVETPLDIDPVFARFAALVNQLHVGLSQYYQLYRHEYSRVYDHLSRTFAYLDSRGWHLDPERDVELRKIVLGEENKAASSRSKSDHETTDREGHSRAAPPRYQGADAGGAAGPPLNGRGITDAAGPGELQREGGHESDGGCRGVVAERGRENGTEGGGKGSLEIPGGVPLLMPLPKLPFIECRFLPPHVPERYVSGTQQRRFPSDADTGRHW